MTALVLLTPPPGPVQPGGETVVAARVRNTGTVVDQFTFQILGPAAQWGAVEPGELSLFPGAEGEIEVVFRPPLGAQVPAGTVNVGLMTRSSADGSTSVEETAVTILPVVIVSARLVPRRSKGSSGARHRLKLRNKGNTPATVALNASDPDEALSLRVLPKTVTIAAGGETEARVKLRPMSRTWTGGAEPKEFTVSVVPQGAEPQAVPGTFVQMPTVRGWMLMGLAAAAIVLVGILLLSHARQNGTSSQATLAGTAGQAASTSTGTGTGTSTSATGTGSGTSASASSASTSTSATGSGGAAPQHLQSAAPGGLTQPGGNGNHATGGPATAVPTPWPNPPASLFAVVDAGGNILRQSGGVAYVPCGYGTCGYGTYDLEFNRDVSQCSWTATPSGGGQFDASVSSNDSNSPNVVRVQTKAPYGVTAGGFTLNVVCDTSAASQWIVVGYHVDRVRGTPGTSVQKGGTGQYVVSFPTSVQGCAYIATNGDPGGQNYVYSPAVVLAYPGGGANQVVVEFHDPGGSGAAFAHPSYAPASSPDPNAFSPFHLQVYCNPNAYWVRVTSRASVAGTHGVSLGAQRSNGVYDVGFDRDLSACAWLATGGNGAGVGHISTTTGPGGARVTISDLANNGADLPFSFVALC